MCAITNNIDPRSLIPNGWHGITVLSEDDLIFLGAHNLRLIAQYWRDRERMTSREIMRLKLLIDALEKNVNDYHLAAHLTYYEWVLEKEEARKRRFDDFANYVKQIRQQSEIKPCFPSHRPLDWFNFNNTVKCYVNSENALPEYRNRFIEGRVIRGYRYHEGFVTVMVDHKVQNDMNYHDGRALGYGGTRPEVILLWEYEYLRSHPDYLIVWLNSVKSDYLTNFDFAGLRNALSSG